MPVKGTADSLNQVWSACEDIKYTVPPPRGGTIFSAAGSRNVSLVIFLISCGTTVLPGCDIIIKETSFCRYMLVV